MLRSITITELTAIWVVHDDKMRRGYHMKYEGNCPHYQLVYKLSGKNRLLFDGQEYEERENSFRFWPKGRVNANYEVYTDEPGECIDVCFQTAEPIEADCFVHYFESNTHIRGLFVQLERLWRLKREGYYHRCMALVYEILTELEKATRTYRPSREEQLLRPAVSYLEEHFLDEIEYSRLAGYDNVYYFSKVFKQVMGVPPLRYAKTLSMRRTDGSVL